MVYKIPFYYARANVDYDRIYFDKWDHLMFAVVICASTIVGFYYGYLRKFLKHRVAEPTTTETTEEEEIQFGSAKMYEYLLASRKMTPFPVAMSLVAFYISGISIVGIPTEIYYFGTQIWLLAIGIILSTMAVQHVYLPVFCALRTDTSYHYLEMRFNSTVRSFAAFLFIIDGVTYLPFVLYAPSLAYSQVTGLNFYVIYIVAFAICTAYTVIGGIRAVVHTNVWQCSVMYLSVVVLVIYGWKVASDTVFKNAFDGGRLIFLNFSPSLYERHTVWSVLIGQFFYFTSYNSVHQSAVQRYMSLPSFEKCKQTIKIYITTLIAVYILCFLAGLLVYDAFRNCDPMSAGYIEYDDQLMPLYMMVISANFTTLAGLLIGGLFCAALSTLSGLLNTVAFVIMKDVVKGTFQIHLSEKMEQFVIMSTIILLGCLNLLLLALLIHVDGIYSVMVALTSIGASVTLGMFTMGMLVPWTNTTGTISGAIAGILMTSWTAIGRHFNAATILYMKSTLKFSVDDCPTNATLFPRENPEDVFPLYRISPFWVAPVGLLTTLLVGVIVSFITKPTRVHTLDAMLMSPVIHRFLPPECWRRRARSYNE